MAESHTNNWRLLRKYIQAENASYAELVAARPRTASFVKMKDRWFKRTRRSWVSLNDRGIAIPPAFLTPYNFPKEAFLPDDLDSVMESGRLIYEMTQLKYQLRGHNALRELDRWSTFCPEVVDPDTSYDILELSSGGCGGAEVAHHFGHTYQPTDFLAGRGSVYAPIHASLNLSVIDFDGSKTPYGFADKSFDMVACFQAIDAYGDEEHYPAFIDEMLRIARRKVVIVFNPGLRARREKLENGDEALIKAPLTERYKNIAFMRCPSTGRPAAVIRP